ncbi:interferon alpha-inducible protein 27, mitochondrial-like [Anguilla anguilla]|uniref:interferon alpha-inducible protein 27, mitochondrial-like n=1 Tax=Anguilla anguilla TaxID=7936 RepID=UPI0015ADFBA7|nr:interferon alpha-inducible protein 27, mitochondrial-like [Anguilla anguilla]
MFQTNTLLSTMGLFGLALGAALGVGAAAVAIPLVVGAVGFTAASAAAGSVASSMMSAVANGGGVAAGGVVARDFHDSRTGQTGQQDSLPQPLQHCPVPGRLSEPSCSNPRPAITWIHP